MGRLRRLLSLADSPIGRDLARPTAIVMAIVALALTANDLQLFGANLWQANHRAFPGAVAVIVFTVLARDHLHAIGIRGAPLPSVRYWLRALVVIAIIFAVIIGIAFAVYLGLGYSAEAHPSRTLEDVWGPVIDAPIVEETVYRWILVTGLVAATRSRWFALVISGVTFGYLHVLYNVPAANNLVGGFFFAWMYLRSGSILVPMTFHALGNAAIILINLLLGIAA